MTDTAGLNDAGHAEIGVFGGSGFYSFLEDVTEVEVDTPYGRPSAPFHLGSIGERKVAFLPRHGTNHQYPPHRINYRANLWAMRSLGVTRILAPCASGSLQPHIHPGEFVICDQFVDRTTGRADTFFEGPTANHVSMADPYCPELATVALETAQELIFKFFDDNLERVRALLFDAIAKVPAEIGCECAAGPNGIEPQHLS